MKITRELTKDNTTIGVFIILTPEELRNAYYEQEYNYDRQDIVDELEQRKEDDE